MNCDCRKKDPGRKQMLEKGRMNVRKTVMKV